MTLIEYIKNENTMKNIFGAHTSTEGGVSRSVTLGEELGFNAIQIFTKNANRWTAKCLTDDEVERFTSSFTKSKIKYLFSHDSYLINLCAVKDEIYQKSIEAFKDEIKRCGQLKIPYLVFHPGAHLGEGESKGIEKISYTLNNILNELHIENVICLIETTAGQGSTLGYKFEQIKEIIKNIEDKSRVGVCLDTAHIFAAGYDIRSKDSYERTIKDFDELIGLDYLRCIHMNDSKKDLGSRVDRHDHIGKGFIGLEGFKNIVNDKRLKHVPMILETPKTKGQLEDVENIKVLQNLILD